jgi:hypothetical protein
MNSPISTRALLACTILAASCPAAFAGQAPGTASSPDIAISHHDRVYAAEQFSNTVSVTDPADNKLLGVIRLGDPQPGNSVHSTRDRCWFTAWGFRRITRRLPWSRSARIP